MLSLTQFRKKPKGFPDLLSYAALVDSGVVQLKDGSLLAGYLYQGEDTQSVPADRMNTITKRVNSAMVGFGDGWAIWVDAVRMETAAYSPPEASHFPDEVTALIDAERRRHFTAEGQHFETEYAIVVQFKPPSAHVNKIGEFMYDDDASGPAMSAAQRHLETFQKTLAEFEDTLSDAVKIKRMGGYSVDEDGRVFEPGKGKYLRDELVNYLQVCLTGDLDPVNIPAPAMYMDYYLGGQDFWTGNTPRFGKKFIAVVGIDTFPTHTSPALLETLDRMAIPYRFSTRFIGQEQHQAIAALKKYQRGWDQKKFSFWSQLTNKRTGPVNQDAVMMSDEIAGALTDAQSGLVAYGYYTAVIVLMDEDRDVATENASIIAREIRRLGFTTRVEEANTVEAWLGSLPGHPHPNVRRPLIHTLSLADLLPLFSVWPGRATNPCPFYPEGSPPLLQGSTTGATPFRVNLHVDDVGHTVVLGPTGAGKSVLLNTLAVSHRRYPNARVSIFDKGFSAEATCRAVGGQHYAPGAEGVTLGLCPLKHLDKDDDFAWAAEYVERLFHLSADKAPTPEQRKDINAALRNLRSGVDGRSISDFITVVQDKEIRAALEHYAADGPLGTMLDAQDDDLEESTFTVFEMEHLLRMGEKNAMPVLLYLFRRFEKSLDGSPSLLILDEAWVMLAHEVFREKIEEWLRTLRKANCAVVLATQSIDEAVKSGLLGIINESCPTKIFLPNDKATQEGTATQPGPRDLYIGLGLNERQIELLEVAQRKRDYYFTSPEGQRLFRLDLGPIALAFVAASGKGSLARVRHLHQTQGSRWWRTWLNEHGFTNFQIDTLGGAYAQAA